MTSGRTIQLVVLMCIAAIAAMRSAVPATSDGTLPAAATRARIQRLFADIGPHPVGSPAGAVVRTRIVEQLREIGLEAEEQVATVCADAACATVTNVVARLPGQDDGPGIMVTAHYDSVGAGPGISDDGVGVATVLEIAKVLRADVVPRHQVVFLLTDGEESGLLGARAFVKSTWSTRVAVVVNLEARGTSGPSLMFETSAKNGELVAAATSALPHPVTSSLLPAIYSLVPNQTDLTIYKDHGYAGLNFAFLGDGPRYHTNRDDIAHISDASLRHHGENALSVVRALSKMERLPQAAPDAVFFDVLSVFVVRWSTTGAIVGAVAVLTVFVLTLLGLLRRGDVDARALVRAWLAAPVAVASGGVVGLVVAAGLHAVGAVGASGPARTLPVLGCGVAIAIAVLCLAAALFRGPKSGPVWIALGFWHAILALVTAISFPGASYLFLAPAAAATCGLSLWTLKGSRGPASAASVWVAMPICGVSLLLWTVPASILVDALGLPSLVVVAAAFSLVLLPLANLVSALTGDSAGRALAIGGTGLVASFLAALLLLPPTVDDPFPATMTHVHDLGRDIRGDELIMDAWGASTPASEGFHDADVPYAWGPAGLVRSARSVDLTPPQVIVTDVSVSNGTRFVRAKVRSTRSALVVNVYIAPRCTIREVRLAGTRLEERALGRAGEWRRFTSLTTPPDGVDIELDSIGLDPIEVVIVDETPGLPSGDADLIRGRTANGAATDGGDVTLVALHTRI